jgi:hypothetical protein
LKLWPQPFFATNTCGYGSLRAQGRRMFHSRLARFTAKV